MLGLSEKKQKSDETQDPPWTAVMMANLTAKMMTAKEKRRTTMFLQKPCFAAGGSMNRREETSGKKETEDGKI